MTDAEYLAWLLADNRRMVLASLTYYTGTYSVTATENVGTSAWSGIAYAGGPIVEYKPLIAGVPDLAQSIDVPLSAGVLELHNETGELDSWLDRSFDGRPITIRLGGPEFAWYDFRVLFEGIIDHVRATHDRLQVIFRDVRERLNKPLMTTMVNDDVLTPVCLTGRNVSPVLQDSTNRVYRVTKGPMVGVSAVRANGTAVSFTQNTAGGTITLDTSATGRITCDVVGESGGYDGTAGAIIPTKAIVHLATLAGMSEGDFDAPSLDALRTKLGATANSAVYAWFTERINTLDAIEAVLSPRGCYWGVTRDGKIRAWRLDLPAGSPVLTLYPHNIVHRSLTPTEWEPAVWVYEGGPVPNSTVQDPSSLDAGLSLDVRTSYGRRFLDKADNSNQFFPPMTYAGAVVGGMEVWPMTRSMRNAEISRLAGIRNVPRRRYKFQVIAPTLPIYVGDEIRIIYPRFGFSGGANVIVVGMRESFMKGITELEVWK